MEGGRDPFFGFGHPFGSFGSPFGSLGGFGGGQRSMISNFFGGRDPFEDPFFTRPFGSMFESSFFGSAGGPFMNPLAPAPGFLEHQPPQRVNHSRGPIIEELNSDEEEDGKEGEKEKQDNPRKHRRTNQEPLVEDPDDETTEKRGRHMAERNVTNQLHHMRSQPQSHAFTFQSSTVSYGGANGAYYTSSRTRRSGSDGLTFEECKEADSTTRQATHRVSRGINDKGHSFTRKLKSDGHVDTLQTLHNLNEDELTGFEEAWKGSARKHLPGLSEQFSIQDAIGSGSSGQHRGNRGGWALPAAERSKNTGSLKPGMAGTSGPPARTKAEHGEATRHRSKWGGSGNHVSRR